MGRRRSPDPKPLGVPGVGVGSPGNHLVALEPLGGSREPIGGVPGASGKGREPRGAPGGSREPPGRIPRASWGVPGAAVWGVPYMAAGAMGVLLYPGGWLDTMGMKPMGARIGGIPQPTHTHSAAMLAQAVLAQEL